MPVHPLLALARKKGNPVIEGSQVMFLWQGTRPPLLIDDMHNWDDQPQKLARIKNELWVCTLTLPEDAYLEYAFLDEASGERLPDPLNPNRIENGVDAFNQFFYMPKGKPTPLVTPRKGQPKGSVTRHEVPTHDYAVGARRTVYLYRPPVDGPVPLVIVYDGVDYLHRGKLNVIVDNLIADGKIMPFAMAMVQNGGQARTVEYSCAESTLELLIECVFPLVKEHIPLALPEEEPYGVIGASLGGLQALYSGLRLPRLFCKILCVMLPGQCSRTRISCCRCRTR